MPQKRKQQDVEVTTPVTASSFKRFKSTPPAPKRKALEDINSNLPTHAPAKKAKHNSQVKVKATATPLHTSTAERKPASEKKSKNSTDGSSTKLYRLVPRGERQTAKVGHKDETLLRIICDNTISGEVKELHFRNITHSSINWNNAEDIGKINSEYIHLYTVRRHTLT
jgi:hypothetical protein